MHKHTIIYYLLTVFHTQMLFSSSRRRFCGYSKDNINNLSHTSIPAVCFLVMCRVFIVHWNCEHSALSVYRKVHVLGSFQNIKMARTAICNLILGKTSIVFIAQYIMWLMLLRWCFIGWAGWTLCCLKYRYSWRSTSTNLFTLRYSFKHWNLDYKTPLWILLWISILIYT